MKTISYDKFKNTVKELTIAAIYDLDEEVVESLKLASKKEEDLSKIILDEIIENAKIARERRIPICQDTGIVVVFLEIGNLVFCNFSIEKAINEAVKEAYVEEYFRMSIVGSPITRKNTFTNTPCIIHTKIVEGDSLKITVCPKGAGSENLSALKMLTPSVGKEGIIDFVIDTVINAGGKVCPPMIVGVGIGGNFEECALISKKALLRPISDQSIDEEALELEKTIFEKINNLNIGPMGVGGKTTCLAVKVNLAPCHIASLPVAVNFQCHASRHKEAIL